MANTQKGGVIDLNNKDITKAFSDFQHVEVRQTKHRIDIVAHHHESKIVSREEDLISRLKKGEPLRKGGLFSGMGLLCRSVHRGLKASGVAVQERFTNELESLPFEAIMAGNEIWSDCAPDAVAISGDIF